MARGSRKANSGSELGYEAKIWQMAAALRNNIGATEYLQVALRV